MAMSKSTRGKMGSRPASTEHIMHLPPKHTINYSPYCNIACKKKVEHRIEYENEPLAGTCVRLELSKRSLT